MDISFLNFQSYIYFWANLGQKKSKLSVLLKMDIQSMARMLIHILTVIFSISNPKPIFEQIWAEKVKIITFMIL